MTDYQTIHSDELYSSIGASEACYQVVGGHPDTGYGILGYHSCKEEAEYNAALVKARGGDAVVGMNFDAMTDWAAPDTEGEDTRGWLLIDDWRDYAIEDVARDARQARQALKTFRYEGVMFDYDLRDPEGNGLNVMEWAYRHGHLPRYVYICSTHPQGVRRMEHFLRDHGYVEEENHLKAAGVTVKGYWRRLEEGETRPKRKVTVYLNR